jgi:hypothetical protein
MRGFGALADFPDLWIPAVVTPPSNGAVLTLEFSPGERIDHFARQRPEAMPRLINASVTRLDSAISFGALVIGSSRLLLTPMGGCTRGQGSSNEPRPLTAVEAALDGARPSTGAQGLAIDTSVTLPSLSLKWKRTPAALDHRFLSLSSRWKVGTSTVTVAACRPSPRMALLAE